jgi:hypothetical protein
MKVKWLLLSLCGGALITACNQQAPSSAQMAQNQASQTVGRTLNPQRKELGLRTIGDNWVLYRANGNQEDWVVRKGSPSGKTVFKDASGNVTTEEDHFYSGARYYYRHDYGWEFISVSYDYRTKQVAISYSGTNQVTEGILSKFLMPSQGPTSDVAGVMAAVKQAATGWPDGPS